MTFYKIIIDIISEKRNTKLTGFGTLIALSTPVTGNAVHATGSGELSAVWEGGVRCRGAAGGWPEVA